MITDQEFIVALNRAILNCCKAHARNQARYVIIVGNQPDRTPAITTNIGMPGAAETLVAAALHIMISSEPEIDCDDIGPVVGSA